jgi:hypothetical protein
MSMDSEEMDNMLLNQQPFMDTNKNNMDANSDNNIQNKDLQQTDMRNTTHLKRFETPNTNTIDIENFKEFAT